MLAARARRPAALLARARLLSAAADAAPAVVGEAQDLSLCVAAERRTRVVILGTGWGSYACLKRLKSQTAALERVGRGVDVIVVSPRNHFLFTPLLASTAVGTLEFRSIIEPCRETYFRNEAHFHLASAERVDTEQKTVLCRSALDGATFDVPYDVLVMGVGARSNTFGIPGVAEHALFMKELAHARAIRQRLLRNLELAVQPTTTPERRRQLLHTVVVGGGPTGVEFSAELYDFVTTDVAKYFPGERDAVRVSLVEANEILGAFSEELRDFALRKLRSRPEMSVVRKTVVAVHEDAIEFDDGSREPCGLVVWGAGIRQHPVVEELPWAKGARGAVLVDDFLRVPDADGVFALGDCAATPAGGLPPTAQVATRQAAYLGDAIPRLLRGELEAVQPFTFKQLVIMAYLGRYEALADWGRGPKMAGLHSWLLWRSAYLTQLGSWRLRLQTPMDWFKTFFLGRDMSQF